MIKGRDYYFEILHDSERKLFELERDYKHLKEEYHQQEEILDGIETKLMSYLDRETAQHLYNEIFYIKG